MRMIITGAASGIGRAVALLAAPGGTKMLLVDRDKTALEETAQLAGAAGGAPLTQEADLALADSAVAIVRRAETEFAGLDCIVSNAGMLRVGELKSMDVESFDHSFAVNTRPTWLLGKAAYAMLAQSRGNIVATNSISAAHATPPLGAYSASKAALSMLVKQMALEWGPDGIRCNCVSPGPTYTGITKNTFNDANDPAHLANRQRREAAIPLRKLGQPEEVAAAILFLASAAASHITGVDLTVDGGLTIALMPAAGGGSGHAR